MVMFPPFLILISLLFGDDVAAAKNGEARYYDAEDSYCFLEIIRTE
ncbi:Hypothetical protein, putative [Bodo saltans]|uniref:Membrane-associated protein n=1 Tax=Bodo saltans TaxID=75058 RepID=A0A0S4J9V2_BODSA|nr:Hypothetical protein, putative [Bodo saltans]|eukprot:CUG79139.1 Hypothetical protein, putative [Bodo saltans]